MQSGSDQNYYVQVQQLEAGKVKLEADLNQVRKDLNLVDFLIFHFLT